MYRDRILLTVKDILEKEFKIDTRGFRPQEVDKFLDIIIRDYEEFIKIVEEKETENKDLSDENIRLRQEIRTLNTKLEIVKESTGNEVNTADVLKRISNLEKIIFGRENKE